MYPVFAIEYVWRSRGCLAYRYTRVEYGSYRFRKNILFIHMFGFV